MAALQEDDACRVILLKGAGSVFSAGHDLKEIAAHVAMRWRAGVFLGDYGGLRGGVDAGTGALGETGDCRGGGDGDGGGVSIGG